jgi:hypothetical protein
MSQNETAGEFIAYTVIDFTHGQLRVSGPF